MTTSGLELFWNAENIETAIYGQKERLRRVAAANLVKACKVSEINFDYLLCFLWR